ncbi:hypothetical protein CR513_21382, partial [Mucuna pruriens]
MWRQSNLLAKLISMKYKGKGNIREYIMEMYNLASKLKSFKLEFGEDLLVHLILISLPAHFRQFKVSYNNQKDKWSLNELISHYLQEEERLKMNFNIERKLKSSNLIVVVNSIYDELGEQRPGLFALFLRECGIVSQYTMLSKPSMNDVEMRYLEEIEFKKEENIRNVVFEEEFFNDIGQVLVAITIWESTLATQKEGIDYKETFCPVSSKDSFRTIMARVAHFDFEIHHMDVKTVFLNVDIDKTIYMVQLENFVQMTLSLRYIGLLHETKRFLTKNFEMKDLGKISFVLGIQILKDCSQDILRLLQENYINKVLDRFDMKDSKSRDTPIVKGDKFSLK